MAKEIRITLAQLGATKTEEDIEKFYSALEELKDVETDVILFPEYFPIWPTLNEFEGEVRKKAKQFAKENDKMVVYGCSRNKEYNSLIVAMPSGEGKVYDKRILFAYEKKLKKGEGDLIIDYKGVKIGFFICYELFFPGLIQNLANKDLDLLLGISKNPKSFTRIWKSLVKTRAFENMIPVVVCSNFSEGKLKGESCSLAVIPPSEVIANPKVEEKFHTFDLKIKEGWKEMREKGSPKKDVGEMFKGRKYIFPGDRKQYLRKKSDFLNKKDPGES